MFERFYPNERQDSTYLIDFKHFYEKGYRGILFDIDNTLVAHGADADDETVLFFKELEEIGFLTCLISNNKEERVERFNKKINTNFIYNAHKPSGRNYQKAMDIMGTNLENTIFVGDQLFTDVFGAKRIGMYSILVNPIHPKEEIQIVLKRYLEKIVLFFYERKRGRRKNER